VQGRGGPNAPRPGTVDHPLRDATGRPLERVARTVASLDEPAGGATSATPRWLRIAIDPTNPRVFDTAIEQGFDDPSGELYGAPPPR
jgi:hypothetical protein